MTLSRRTMLMGASAVCVFAQSSQRSALANDTAQYSYDALGRLIRVELSDGTLITYTYDAAGNRTQVVHGDVPFNQTIQITGTGPVNLRTLANNAGYSGATDATIIFQVGSSVTISGAGGAAEASGGRGIDTGTWPSGSFAISLTLQVSGKVYGGGGGGGVGAGAGAATAAGNGGDAIYAQENLTLVVNSGGQVKGGGGGGGGAACWVRTFGGEPTTWNGGGGGGGFPNGTGGPEGSGDSDVSNPGANGTTSGGGAGGTGGTAMGSRVNGTGAAGGNAATAGTQGGNVSGSGGTGTWTSNNFSSGGAAGYAVRKNGKTVNVTNNGTITGTVG